MATTARIIASLLLAAPLFAQGTQAGSLAQVTVRILKADQWAKLGGYNLATEVRLKGVVELATGGVLHLRMPFGSVRVELGQAGRNLVLRIGQALEVVASKVMQNGDQHLLARVVVSDSKEIRLRDAQGVPMQEAAQG